MRISIGTAQFGKKYGISNISGKTKKSEISKILQIAKQNNISLIDTAQNYLNVENILGSYNLNDFKISTKISEIENVKMEINNDFIYKKMIQSLQDLRIKKIDTIFLHNTNDLLSKKGDKYFDDLVRLKKNKLVNKIGITVYSIEEISEIISNFDIDVVQCPFNIFDNRLVESGMYNKLVKKKIEIEVRSIFLQGLLLMSAEKIPSQFQYFQNQFKLWFDFLKENQISQLDACINFIKRFKKIKRVIIGVENSKQFLDIIKSFNKNLYIDFPKMSINQTKLINPHLW